MLGFIREGKALVGYCAADRVVGRAAAMLFVKTGVRAVFADELDREYHELREKNAVRKVQTVSMEEARKNRLNLWD